MAKLYDSEGHEILIPAQVARLEAEKAEDRRVWQKSEDTWVEARNKWWADVSLLREQRDEAQAANAALAAALAEAGERVSHEDCLSWEGGDCNCIVSRVEAALSDTAGEGWLPPEKVRPVAARLRSASRVFHSEQGHAGSWPECKHLQCSQDRAALVALGGK